MKIKTTVVCETADIQAAIAAYIAAEQNITVKPSEVSIPEDVVAVIHVNPDAIMQPQEAEKPKRKRRTKAEIKAAEEAEAQQEQEEEEQEEDSAPDSDEEAHQQTSETEVEQAEEEPKEEPKEETKPAPKSGSIFTFNKAG